MAKKRRRPGQPLHRKRRLRPKRPIPSRRSVHSQPLTVEKFLERLAAERLAAERLAATTPSSSIAKQEEEEEEAHNDQPQGLIPLIKSFSNVM